jgi:hypothetical protein
VDDDFLANGVKGLLGVIMEVFAFFAQTVKFLRQLAGCALFAGDVASFFKGVEELVERAGLEEDAKVVADMSTYLVFG